MRFKHQTDSQAKGIRQQSKVVQAKKQTIAPPVYRPQPTARCLQAKMASTGQLPSSSSNGLPFKASIKRSPSHVASAEVKRTARELPNKYFRRELGGAIQRAAAATPATATPATATPAAATPAVTTTTTTTAAAAAAVHVTPPPVAISDADIVVEASATKHKALFHDGLRFPNEDDIRRIFKINLRFGAGKPDPTSPGCFVWSSGSNKMVYKIVAGKYHVFHYHALSYKP